MQSRNDEAQKRMADDTPGGGELASGLEDLGLQCRWTDPATIQDEEGRGEVRR